MRLLYERMKDLEQQYKDESNLQKRIQIHQYGVAKESWYEFLKKQMILTGNCKVLEIGCGTGTLWEYLLDGGGNSQVQQIILSDVSEGMLSTAKENLEEWSNLYNMQFKRIEATNIPYDDDSFDVVIANHVLYHVPDVEKALAEISRVLKSEGTFYATTIGSNNMPELKDIVRTYFPDIEKELFFTQFLEKFSLENALEKTGRFFQKSERIHYEDYLLLPNPKPLIEYIESFNFPGVLDHEHQKKSFENILLKDLDFTKGFRISKEIGLLKCEN
ncbi:putative methyltransferase YcgJ [compost metagenome]